MSCNCNSGVSEINTSTCEEACTTCGAGVNATASCGTSTCQCNSAVPGASTPYYNCAAGVQETHCKTVVQALYEAALTSSTAFNMPACLENAVISFPGLKKIQTGSYLWNATYGYLKVMSFDYISSQVTVKNTCEPGNASPGTAIPSCTLFNVVDEPCCDGTNGQVGVFLETDFVAPADGNCIDIEVTGVAGLTVGSSVQISSGIYNVSAIVTPTVITICNGGSGVAHGTTVEAKDGSGSYITPITPLSTNACDNAATTRGVVIVCDNGTQRPLTPTALGQVPSVVDVVNKEVEFVSLSIPVEVCTLIDADITLVAGTVTYTVLVASSASFSTNQLLVIHFGAYETARWKVTGVPDPTHVIIEKTTAQAGNDVIPSGNSICLASCCEQIVQDIATTYVVAGNSGSVTKAGNLVPVSPVPGPTNFPLTLGGDEAAVEIINASDETMEVIISVVFSVEAALDTFGATASLSNADTIFNCFYGVQEAAIAAAYPALVYSSVASIAETRLVHHLDEFDPAINIYTVRPYTTRWILSAGNKFKANAYANIIYVWYTDPVHTAPRMAVSKLATSIVVHGVTTQAI